MDISVGTYNLMKPNQSATKYNKDWNQRKEDLLKNIAAAKTDIICVQELSARDETWMKTSAEKMGYDFSYATCQARSGVGILFKKDKFNLVDKKAGIFQGADDRGSIRMRAFTQLDLEDINTKKISRVASMHLYGGTIQGNPLGRQQIENFRQQIEENDTNVSQIILAGDFNSDAKHEINNQLDGPCTFLLNPHSHSPYAYNTVFSDGVTPIRTTNRSNRHLDWVFVGIKNTDTNKKLADIKVISLPNQIQNASDHVFHAVQIKEPIFQDQVTFKPACEKIEEARAPKSREDFKLRKVGRDVGSMLLGILEALSGVRGGKRSHPISHRRHHASPSHQQHKERVPGPKNGTDVYEEYPSDKEFAGC